MQPIRLIQGDTGPDLYMILYDKSLNTNSQCSSGGNHGLGVACYTHTSYTTPTKISITGAVNLDFPDVAVLCKFRAKNSTQNVFSVYAEKIRDGEFGEVLLRWPFYSLDGALGYYELEVSIMFGLRVQTAVSPIQFSLNSQFADRAYISDDEGVMFRNGQLYLRNMDTGSLFGISLTGSSFPALAIDTAPTIPDIPATFAGVVYFRIISGQLYMYDADDTSWHVVSLVGSTLVPTLQIGSRIDNVNSSAVQSLQVTLKDGKLYLKNISTSEWHCVEIRGATAGTEHFALGTGAAL